MEQGTSKKRNKMLCFCRSIKPFLLCVKLFGILPMTSEHRNDECIFKRSKVWTVWSVLVVCIWIYHLTMYAEVLDLFRKDKSHMPLHVILINIVSAIYCTYVIIIVVISTVQSPKVVIAMNKISSVVKEGLLCQSALKVILRVQYGLLAIGVLSIVIQFSALTYLHVSEHYEVMFNYKIVINQLLQNATFAFYLVFLSYCAVFMGMLACLEGMIIWCFNFQSVHPSEDMYETNNTAIFLGISYKLCKTKHTNNRLIRKYRSHEIVDYFRCLHEEVTVLLYDCNECINFQLLCHMIVELAALIINYYAVVIYFIHDFNTPVSSMIHFLNCLFVILHTLGIFAFLRNSQQLQNMVKGLIPILLEYSTRIISPEEHQQIRLFIEKLKQHRPINASGVVNIDLSIAGSICANILTYVLVALQFNVAKN